jgi:anaerobic magnesium-protoporphyrin IX monomethyl ester cyclase
MPTLLPVISAEAHAHAEAAKKAIAQVIKPDQELDTLPPRLTDPKRVLLIVPPGTTEESYGRLSAAAGELPMLGLAYIAASLRDQGHHVRIIDAEILDASLSQVEVDIRTFDPEVIGMTVYITNMRRCATVARIAKAVNPAITVVFGGPQVSVFPEEGFKSPDVDMIVLSEGEIVIRNVMNALGDEEKLREVKGIWFRARTGEIVRNEREGLAGDLDLFPRPALDLYDMGAYYPPVHIRGKKVAHLLTSRGCPFECTFCETKLTFGRSFRYHSTDRVLQEIEELVAQGYDSFQFYDDIFTINKKRVEDLCLGILARGLKIQWMCFTRTNCVTPEMLTLMKQSGCYLITFGGESGDDELLKLIKKSLTVKKNFEGIRMTREAGILTFSSFMLGLPTETPEQTMKSIQFALDSRLDYAVFPITEPYPGTELWVDAKKYGTFDTSGKHRNNLLSENSAVWIPHGRTRDELEAVTRYAMRRFYMRPRQIWRGITNFSYLPFWRAARYFGAGISYFGLKRFNPVASGTRF